MKKQAIAAICLATIIIIAAKFGIFNFLLFFLLAGVVPGTNYIVPSSAMLLGTITLMWLMVLYVTPFEIFRSSSPKRRTKRSSTDAKKRLPRRRYHQI